MKQNLIFIAGLCAASALTSPAAAQEAADSGPATNSETSVYDGDWLSVGVGVGYAPSYDGSDDYVAFPIPVVQGSLGGIGISPRAGGLALDFLADPEKGVGFNLGPSARMRSNRASQIEDKVVRSLGKLDHAVEVGPSVGITVAQVFHEYDTLSFNTDIGWDVAGAHKGMVVSPSLTYFTPLSRGAAVSLSASAEWGDRKFADYYYSISPAQSAASGLAPFSAGKGFTKAGIAAVGGIDLDGDLLNGGFAIVVGGGYSRMLGDAKDTPLTSVRGSPNQWFGAIGIGYTF